MNGNFRMWTNVHMESLPLSIVFTWKTSEKIITGHHTVHSENAHFTVIDS